MTRSILFVPPIWLALLTAAVLLAPTCARSEAANAPAHAAEITAFAALMADARTAGERCEGVTLDEDRIAAAKERLHIADSDYFAFRRTAHDRADDLAARLVTPDAVGDWCEGALRRYGPDGTQVRGALRR